MPELPEVEALARHLRDVAAGRAVTRVDVASMSVLKTADPPHTALVGRVVTGADRRGKYLDLDCDGLHLVVHLARAGWLRWSDALAPAPPKPGRGPIAMRVHLDGPGFDLTEAGTQKRLAAWIVHDPAEVPGIAKLGPDALGITEEEFAAVLAGRSERVKTVLTDQSRLAGVGGAYSDEVLHRAKLSPFATAGKLGEDAVRRLHAALREVLSDAVDRSRDAARLKAEKRSGLRVHGRTGLPCPVCGDLVREVSFADRSLQYCPTCQTGGKRLADRRMSRLLK
ncbi:MULTISPECIES: Fpg/Nei family DNA glycosylase [unclassified Saccharopolyspora]|uniref:Fpg/Nei family DNA glycosylase n=1 Tax=unclassified Saccharopolyspora TaxID=2646250 RepID=UPI001CD38D74|nr:MULTISPECIES: DNA-formamidopyrimidine glycosylase family protein [unclassified Saccharopolyspora]MCA1190306.1 Fpg/Nei family DNA glycosylase [Saccharopolyspora sp. 6T]MCA1193776.1 Fpg/Nei family DNA glycosylase [Saccharopolyspora sp. 6V]MCA1226982.1 Fpg/Nei family DNA glycosylase [Saccharopolyspora sp. 6M]MCA1281787.1 Fpg/Nei family DNA glycosylase [Saccharopolyspora sp. 7B]